MIDEAGASAAEIQALAKSLISRSSVTRSDATAGLAELSVENRRLLVAELRRIRRRCSRLLIPWALAWLCATAVAMPFFRDADPWPAVLAAAVLGGIAALEIPWMRYVGRVNVALILALGPLGDPNAILLLLDAAFSMDDSRREALRNALDRSVEQFDPTRDKEAPRRNARELAWWVIRRYEAHGPRFPRLRWAEQEASLQLTLTLVRTLAAVAGMPELEQMERLAARPPRNDRQQRFRGVLVDLLPGWRARVEGRADAQTLLRGSGSASSGAVGTLLRAADASAADQDPATMLRAAQEPPRPAD